MNSFIKIERMHSTIDSIEILNNSSVIEICFSEIKQLLIIYFRWMRRKQWVWPQEMLEALLSDSFDERCFFYQTSGNVGPI